MAAIHYVTNPETKKVISLSTKNVKPLQISTDINRNRVSFDMWDTSFRAAINDYAELLDETPPTILRPMLKYMKVYAQGREQVVSMNGLATELDTSLAR